MGVGRRSRCPGRCGIQAAPLDYGTRLHHTNIEAYDHVQPKGMMQASVIMAAFLYNSAKRIRGRAARRDR